MENLKVILGKVGKVCSGAISGEEMDSSIKSWIKHEQLFYEEKLILQKWNIPYVYFLMKKIYWDVVPELVVSKHWIMV